MIELNDQGDHMFRRNFGGDTLNTTVYLNRLLPDSSTVYYVTALGNDVLSDEMLNAWQAEGINTDMVIRMEGYIPGLYMIQTDEIGERSFLYWRDNAPVRKLFQTEHTAKLERTIQQCSWIYFSGITLAVLEPVGRHKLFETLSRFRSHGGKIAFDPNYRPALWLGEDVQYWFREAYQHTSHVLPSKEDEEAVWGKESIDETLSRLHAWGTEEVILKRGSASCFVSDGEGVQEIDVIPASHVVDTTAAGDSFNGGYLAKRVSGSSAQESVVQGQRIASQVIEQYGAIVPISHCEL